MIETEEYNEFVNQVAADLTAICADTFLDIKISDLFLGEDNPTFVRHANQVNKLINYVALQVMSRGDIDQRANVMKFFIHLLDKMKNSENKTNNLLGYCAITSGLNSSSITRLTETMDKLTQEERDILVKALSFAGPYMDKDKVDDDTTSAVPLLVGKKAMLIRAEDMPGVKRINTMGKIVEDIQNNKEGIRKTNREPPKLNVAETIFGAQVPLALSNEQQKYLFNLSQSYQPRKE